MRASSAFVRLFIRGLQWDADESNTTFADALKVAARARLQESAKGKVLTGTTSGGTSVTFALPPIGDLTADDLSDVCATLLDRVDEIKAAEPDVTDEALVAALLDRFPSIRVIGSDFRGYQQ